jgi:crotonobetainyl-CoA:carnitine CoA-transferase CaiB-like acyl-CoA transferase
MSPGPLAGIRVVDFGRFIAGPYCSMLLADMGADVIRVDRRQGSEDRYIGPVADDGHGGHYLSLNRNKRSLTLDVSRAGSADIIERLARGADVIIANLPVAVLKKMRIDFESLQAIKPDIILARISTFGPDGPYANRLGFDAIAQAMSGAMSLTGFPDRPIRSIVPFEDFGTALHTAFGIMVALYTRTQTGRGQIVDGSLLATAVTFMQPLLAERSVGRIEREPIGNGGLYSAPTDTYRTKDGWIIVQIIGNDMFARWAHLVGRVEMIADPDFADDTLRQSHRTALDDVMNAWLANRTCAEALALMETARVPAGPLLGLDAVLEDPQVKARGLLHDLAYPGMSQAVPVAATPVRLSDTPGQIRHRAPTPGEHTDEILAELGYSAADIADLYAVGTV